MIQTVSVFAGVIVGLVAGHIVHELSHYAVLRVAGYDTSLVVGVPLRVEWRTPVPIPLAARVAAVAPAVVGAAAVIATIGVYAVAPLLLPVCIGGIISLCMLSPADRDIALGRTETLS